MDCAHLHRPEEIPKVGRDRREPAAVHAHNNGEATDEDRYAAHTPCRWNGRVERDPQEKEGQIGPLPTDVVRNRGPHKPPAEVEQAQQPHESSGRGGRDGAREHLLNHRRGLGKNSDSGRYVHEEHDPQLPELRRAYRLIRRNACVRNKLLRSGRW